MVPPDAFREPGNWQWRAGPVPPGPAVVFDMDGVLSDASRRQHYLEHPFHDWESFFAACGDDELIDEVARLLDVLDSDLRVVLLTARPARVRPQTLGWLDRYQLRWDLLVMRDWESFFEACGEDELIAEVARLLDVISDEHRIVLLTARPMRVLSLIHI